MLRFVAVASDSLHWAETEHTRPGLRGTEDTMNFHECPRCKSQDLKNKNVTKGSGWGLAVLFLLMGIFLHWFFLFGILFAGLLSGKKVTCRSCGFVLQDE